MSKSLPSPEYIASLPVLTTEEAAIYLRMSKTSLCHYRMKGGGPLYIKHTQRKILYRRADLDAWLAERAFSSSSHEAVASAEARV